MRCIPQAGRVLAAIPLALAVLGGAQASSHREAPFITTSPKVDATDFYMFRSYEAGRADYVSLIANYVPLQDAYGGPNYFAMDPNALYEIHVDNNGDAKEDLSFQFRFKNTLANDGAGISLNIGGKSVGIPLIQAGGVDSSQIVWRGYDGIGRNTRMGLNFTERGFGVRAPLGVSDRAYSAASQLQADEYDWDALFGYRAQAQGKKLKLQLGYSHDVDLDVPEGLEVKTPDQTTVEISGIDKQAVGQFAAEIRRWRKPEPYKGKGIKYRGEYIFRKEGKKK